MEEDNREDLELARRYKQRYKKQDDRQIDRLFDPNITKQQLQRLIPDESMRMQVIRQTLPVFAIKEMIQELRLKSTGLISKKSTYKQQSKHMKIEVMNLIHNFVLSFAADKRPLTFCIIDVQNALHTMDPLFRERKKTLNDSFRDNRLRIMKKVSQSQGRKLKFVWVLPGESLSITPYGIDQYTLTVPSGMDDDKMCIILYTYIRWVKDNATLPDLADFPKDIDAFILTNDRLRDWIGHSVSPQDIHPVSRATGSGGAKAI